MKFKDYRIIPELKANLQKLGFERPTDIQFKAIPNIQKGEDVLAIAQTGTGKTAAFAIPVIDKIHVRKNNRRKDGIKCVVMAPTRELCIQLGQVFEKLAKNTRVKTFCVFGGVEQDPQIARLQKGIDIMIATPGRVFDLVHQGHMDLHRVEILVLDEADHMLDLGFIKDIRDLIRFLPKTRQTLFFSATINDEIKKLAYSLVNKPVRIQLSPKDPVSKNINHGVAFIEMDDKRFFLESLIHNHPDSKLLVFARTKVRVERVKKAMERVDISCCCLHGDMDQSERIKSLSSFKQGKERVLIATDVSARGIDIPNVELVVNYDLPDKAENYVHRIGRTGRGKTKGMAISFCSEGEKESFDLIEEFIHKKIPVVEITRQEYKETLKSTAAKEENLDDLLKEIQDLEQFKKKKKGKKK